MENGYDDSKLAERFSGLAVTAAATTIDQERLPSSSNNNNNNDSLFQVMKAVEAAEATIKQQVEENTRLRNELHNRILELERYVCFQLFFNFKQFTHSILQISRCLRIDLITMS